MRTTLGPAGRLTAGLVALSLASSVFGCGKPNNAVNASPPGNAPYGYVPPPPQQRSGGMLSNMSTGKKLAILAGTAALIYLYNKHKHAQGTGAQGKYYLSKNGRVYYRDAKGNAVWVTPPPGGIQVPQQEAQTYEQAAQRGQWDVDSGNAPSAGYSAPGRYAPSGPPGPPGPRR
jgi:hypothetical protein